MWSSTLGRSRVVGVFVALFVLLSLFPGRAADAAPPQAPPEAANLIVELATPPTIDGVCGPTEYGGVLPFSFVDVFSGSGTLYVAFSGPDVYVCVVTNNSPNFTARTGTLFLDPQGDGGAQAQPTDVGLRLTAETNARASLKGNGAGGYSANPGIDGFWEGEVVNTPANARETYEYRLSLGRFFLTPCRSFGLAFYREGATQSASDVFGWPPDAPGTATPNNLAAPSTWGEMQINNGQCGSKARIAYVFRGDTVTANDVKSLLDSKGYTVDLIPLGSVLSTSFSVYDLIMIAEDSGDLNTWGTPASTAAQVAQITAPNKPILGLGEGGYAFFGKLSLFIGWPNGWHGPNSRVKKAIGWQGYPPTFYTTPSAVAGDPISLYSTPVNEVGIYLNSDNPAAASLPADVRVIGLEPETPDHASLIAQSCRQLWGFSAGPASMTISGKDLFVNAVAYGLANQCDQQPPPPPTNCLTISKSANPASGSSVNIGQTIIYTLNYTLSNAPGCPNEAKIVDVVPDGTIYIPNSASNGITPGVDGALIWLVTPGSGSRSFRVTTTEALCRETPNGQIIKNKATLSGGGTSVTSNETTHTLSCPPIGFPNEDPPYIEQEVLIHPYPLIAGRPSMVTVRIRNTSNVSQTIRVLFQSSPQVFGIGINFNTFATRLVTLPPAGEIAVKAPFTPSVPGHHCMQVRVEDPNGVFKTLITQRNLDITEDLKPGVPDTLEFKVANPTGAAATINLVVVNTCPGWSAVITQPVGGILTNVGPNGSDVRTARLTVTPPATATQLGSGCSIDVQGWIGEQLIGGIRKLDVPPVNLPVNVSPPWEEPEITVRPNPPIVGVPAQICVFLQNPLPVSRTVTVEYKVADFGAGIGFTLVATRSITLAPGEAGDYCADWTPTASNNLHRCILITLKQAGFRDMQSQLNIDIQRLRLSSALSDLRIPIRIGNPTGVTQTLQLVPRLIGLNPNRWQPGFVDPPPDALGPGQVVNLQLRLNAILIGLNSPQALVNDDFAGDTARIEVALLLGGIEEGGFTVLLDRPRVYIPVVVRQ